MFVTPNMYSFCMCMYVTSSLEVDIDLQSTHCEVRLCYCLLMALCEFINASISEANSVCSWGCKY